VKKNRHDGSRNRLEATNALATKNKGLNPIPSRQLVVTTIRKEHVEIKSDQYDHEDHSVDEYSTFIYENFQTPINE
jgi:hypothetical protein